MRCKSIDSEVNNNSSSVSANIAQTDATEQKNHAKHESGKKSNNARSLTSNTVAQPVYMSF